MCKQTSQKFIEDLLGFVLSWFSGSVGFVVRVGSPTVFRKSVEPWTDRQFFSEDMKIYWHTPKSFELFGSIRCSGILSHLVCVTPPALQHFLEEFYRQIFWRMGVVRVQTEHLRIQNCAKRQEL